MLNSRNVLLALLAICASSAAAADCRSQSNASPIADMNGVLEEFLRHAKAGDAASVASLYTEDAVLMPPSKPPVRGRDNIEKYWSESFSSGTRLPTQVIEILDVQRCGDLATEVATYDDTALRADGKLQRFRGKFVAVWKRSRKEGWKLHVDMYSGITP